MKVLKDTSKGVSEGARVALQELGLPITGTAALLIVFWKEQ